MQTVLTFGKRFILIGGGLLLGLVCVGLVVATVQYHDVQAQVADDDRVTIRVDGRDRTFYVHTPPGHAALTADDAGLPLLIGLHGGGGSAAGFAGKTEFSDLADEMGAVVVYANGTNRLPRVERLLTWNSGNCCAYAQREDVDDIAFLDALLDYVLDTYAVDPNRVFVTGHSNGGMMSFRAACELSDRLAGIAPVAGALNAEPCTPTDPVSVLMIHGTADDHVLYEGGEPLESVGNAGDRSDTSVADGRDFWVQHNQCAGESVLHTDGDVQTEVFADCDAGVTVQVVTLVGGGHAWPGSDPRDSFSDPPFADYDASAAIMTFVVGGAE
jgi:polyhydroxybutyrate depolymerase